MNEQQKSAEILDIIFKWFGRMWLSNATAQQRAQIVQYVREEAFLRGSDAHDATREAETALREFWAKVDREKIQLSRGEVNDAISESGKSFSENSGDP